MASTLERVPRHLRKYLVRQDYQAYDEIDQAVWRFTLRRAQAVLHGSAHPTYRTGLERTGVTLDRIPRVDEMDRRLSELGWGAVCVDGFIPPRAFQKLQACGVLPIAADIRKLEHLAYTPAPDIIHEAAGHAPMLVDADYAAFLRRIGEVGYRSFTLPHDDAVYQAIYALSVVKERAAGSAAEVRSAERRLQDALASVNGASEAARVARLYWWTVEYGLVGTPRRYSLYGAGLLSSLGESHFCHADSVEKRKLDASCTEVDYDITRAQPQLFVARDFAHLGEVLGDVVEGLSQARGGATGLACALASNEVATVELACGLAVSGRVADVVALRDEVVAVRFAPGWALCWGGEPLPGFVPGDHRVPLELGLGATVDASRRSVPTRLCTSMGRMVPATLLALPGGRPLSGAYVGQAEGAHQVDLLLTATAIPRVAAGPAYDGYFPSAGQSARGVPEPKQLDLEQRELLALYERAYRAWHEQLGADCVPLFASIHTRLSEAHPREWLLRWNLLESLVTLGERSRLTADLARELRELEHVYGQQQPIAMGLRALGY